MKLILKFAACALLIEIIIFVSCKKDPAATKDNHHPPVANAGQDVNVAQTSCSPSNVIQLNGSHSSDADDNISSYLWTKISGPSPITLSNSTTPILRLGSFVAGQYVFELKVTDAEGLSSKDT